MLSTQNMDSETHGQILLELPGKVLCHCQPTLEFMKGTTQISLLYFDPSANTELVS